MKKNYRILLSALLTIVISFAIISYLNKKVNPYSPAVYDVSIDSIKNITINLLKEQNIQVNKQNISVGIKANNNTIDFAQKKYGIQNSGEILTKELAGFYWHVTVERWNGSEENILLNSQEKILKSILGNIHLSYTLSGNLIGYELNIDDSIKTSTISYAEAYQKVEEFLEKHTKFNLCSLDTIKQSNKINEEKHISISLTSKGIDHSVISKNDSSRRSNYIFEGKSYNISLNDSVKIKIGVTGNFISSFTLQSDKIDKAESKKYDIIFEILSIVVYFIVLIAMIIAAFRRYRAYEIGFRNAIIVGILGGLAVIGNFAFVRIGSGWEILLPLVFGFLFSFGGYIIIMAVAESYTREIWSDKLVSLDLITNGYFFHNKIGKAIIRSLCFGIGLAAFYYFLLYVISLIINFSVSVFKDEIVILDHAFTSLYPFVKSINNMLFPLIVIFLYISTFLRSRTKNKTIFILLTAFLWSLVARDITSPIYIGFFIQFVLGLVISAIMWKYDFLTLFFTLIISYSTVLISWSALLPETDFFVQILIGIVLTVLGIIALFSKYRLDDLNRITPKFQKHISERQRLQGELSVARDVQMSFLPQKSPKFEGLEIIARCLPAYEVGGDYYDFIKFSDHNFGIAIGDVSGKGTKAAFYMTLTKGFLKATSRFNTSPSLLLTDMNAMFYENVERGNFISMIFASIDMKNKVLSFSRAGHNPLLLKKPNNEVQVIKPTGIALGLEKGDVFAKTIAEHFINLDSGDYIVMFTDGITEAENNKAEEYGMDRLTEIINNGNFINAGELLELVYKDVQKFTGKTPQHDDMTMIVIRVL